MAMMMTEAQMRRMAAARGIPMPTLPKNSTIGNNYAAGNVGWGQRGQQVPYMSGDQFQAMFGQAQPHAAPKQRPTIREQLVGDPMMKMMERFRQGTNQAAEAAQGNSGPFTTSWGTTQGGPPQQNAGGGQSMFGTPNLGGGQGGGMPSYQPPPGPMTGGYQPTMPQMPGMGGMPPGMGMGGMPPGMGGGMPPWMMPGQGMPQRPPSMGYNPWGGPDIGSQMGQAGRSPYQPPQQPQPQQTPQQRQQATLSSVGLNTQTPFADQIRAANQRMRSSSNPMQLR